jgi:poly(rC)-binding protein 2/3/4
MRCLIVTQDASIIIGRGGAHVNEIRVGQSCRIKEACSSPYSVGKI